MSDLLVETLTFKEIDRQRWRNGNDDILQKSSAFQFLKRVLRKKHRVRPKRFFGEAFVAAHMRHEEGYYCSFKWLTSSTWADSSDLAARDAAEFKRALARHFPRLADLSVGTRHGSDQGEGLYSGGNSSETGQFSPLE